MHNMYLEIFEEKEVLKRAFETNMKTILEVVQRIKNKEIDNILFVARGSSDNAATFGRYAIEIFSGIPTSLSAPSVASIYHKKLNLKNSCVIAVSQSGISQDICSYFQMAKESGALCVAITNNPESKLAKISDFHIYMNVGFEKAVAATKTFSAEVLMLAMLSSALSGDEKEMEELSKIDKIVERALEKDNEIKNSVERFRYIQECFVLGRGLTYPIALEFALKMQETSYVRAKGFSSSDFMHGPIAMVNSEIPVFLLSINDETKEDLTETAKKLVDYNIELYSFTNVEEVSKLSKKSFELHSNGFILEMTTLIQLFSYHLSVLKGQNPDSPRIIQKVTITK